MLFAFLSWFLFFRTTKEGWFHEIRHFLHFFPTSLRSIPSVWKDASRRLSPIDKDYASPFPACSSSPCVPICQMTGIKISPSSFSRMNTHSSPFSHSTHSNLHTLFPMQQRKQPCRTWFHEHFTEILSKSFFPALAVPFHPGSSGTPYRAPQTALFTFLSLKKKTMQNRYSFCGKQWTMPIHPGFLSAHLRRKE